MQTNPAAMACPATRDLVERFAAALLDKLAAAEQKYGYSDGWMRPNWMDECRAKLMEHIAKGDPRDVAAYCAFLWHHGESTAPPTAQAAARGPLTEAEIVEIRDNHLPNQGESFDCIAFARAIEAALGIGPSEAGRAAASIGEAMKP